MMSNRAHFVAFSPSSDKMVLQTRASSAGRGGNVRGKEGVGGKVAATSDGETTSGFGPLFIRVIRMTPGCSNSHPLPPYVGGKGNFRFWLVARRLW